MAISIDWRTVGYSAGVTGGDGGQVIKVTNTNNSGTGSLRWALEDFTNPRIVEFDVGGICYLNEQIEVNGDVTIAGSTAPTQFEVRRGRLRFIQSNAIMEGIRIRAGDSEAGHQKGDRDCMSIGDGTRYIRDILIYNNEFLWSTDECCGIWGNVSNVTFAMNLIGEPLWNSGHPEGPHSMGMLFGFAGGTSSQKPRDISVIGNLLVNCMFRNPAIKDQVQRLEFINNVIYNWGNNGMVIQGGAKDIAIVNNLYKPGPDSDLPAIEVKSSANGGIYASGNVATFGGSGWESERTSTLPFALNFAPIAIEDVEEFVLANVGTRVDQRDDHTRRLIWEAYNSQNTFTQNYAGEDPGHIINSQEDVGGFSGSSTSQSNTGTFVFTETDPVFGGDVIVDPGGGTGGGDGPDEPPVTGTEDRFFVKTGSAASTSARIALPYPGTDYQIAHRIITNAGKSLFSDDVTVTTLAAQSDIFEDVVTASSGAALYASTDAISRIMADTARTTAIGADGAAVAAVDSQYGTIHLIQATSGDRPTWDQSSGMLVNGATTYLGYSGPLGSDKYFAAVVDTTDSTFFCLGSDQNSHYVGGCATSDTNPIDNNAGSGLVYRVNGQVVSNLRTALSAALDVGNKVVLEIVGIDMSTWNDVRLFWRNNDAMQGSWGDVLLADTPATADQAAIRQALADKHSITL